MRSLVNLIKVRALFAIHFDVDVEPAHLRRNRYVLERLRGCEKINF